MRAGSRAQREAAPLTTTPREEILPQRGSFAAGRRRWDEVTDRRAVFGVGAGLVGLLLGLAAAAWEVVALGVIAGATALAVGVAVARLTSVLRRRDAEIDELQHRVEELRRKADREREERETVETAFSSRVFGTAVNRGDLGDALTDPATGLYSEGYFTVALDARIAAARRELRPLSIVLLEVMTGLDRGQVRPADPVVVAAAIEAVQGADDTACRLNLGGFALILEDTPETTAIWAVERLRRTLATGVDGLTMWAGIACYPAHGFAPNDLLAAAEAALEQAREWRQDRIEIASAIDS